MSTNRERLLTLLKERSLKRENLTLASGQQSGGIYVDGRMTALCPEGAYLIGEVLYEHTKDLEFDAIGGLAVGAVPMIASFVTSCFHHERTMEGFFVRAERKSHGTQKIVEGNLQSDSKVLIVDDVITSGGSVLKAIEGLEGLNAEVVLVLSIVDRGAGATELLNENGYQYEYIFQKEDLID